MKKLVLTMLMLLTCGASYALPVGNPAEASLFLNGAWWDNNSCCDPSNPCFSWSEAFSIRVGYYGDFVFNRHLKVKREPDHRTKSIQKTRINTNAGYLAFNFCNRLDFFTTLGATDLNIRTNGSAFSTTPINELVELNFNSQFSWSVGGRVTIWQCDCFAIGIEGQYFHTRAELDNIVLYDTGTILYFNGSERRRNYKEWQAGLGAAYRIATSCPTIAFVPYAAVKWADAKHRLNNTFIEPTAAATLFNLGRLGVKKHWGWAAGITLELCDIIGVTAEGRWGDERALYINGQFRL
jgi:major outer membrane protein